ncbi:MAG: peroxiredoxins-like protein [Thermoleophilia bacterium]|jgi:predicted peroxiredoxin|nr:peroxiredoxins-like protein [Thermoleophilia bacterium]
MADGAKVVINLATGLEDPERVTVAFLVGGAAAEQGKQVAMFLTKEAVRLAVPGVAEAVACDGCPPLGQLFQQFADNGGELLVCPICVNSRKIPQNFVENARLAGATPLWEWIGADAATVFSY